MPNPPQTHPHGNENAQKRDEKIAETLAFGSRMMYLCIYMETGYTLHRLIRIITGIVLAVALLPFTSAAEERPDSMSYRIETSGNSATGTYAPLWFTANRYGLSDTRDGSGYIRAGVTYSRRLGKGWSLQAGADLAGTVHQASDFVVQQAYADIAWRFLHLEVGSRERAGFPLEKNTALSSGMMVEGPNARPVPQVRIGIPRYLSFPRTGNWLALKGHIAYGMFTDGRWQESFVQSGQEYTRKVMYHSKSLMLRIGNREKFPVEFEIGMIMAAQFAGDLYVKNADGSHTLKTAMPKGFKAFAKAFVPMSGGSDSAPGEQVNVEGNHLGSWNFGLNYYAGQWKFRAYLDHYFDDHSQMTFEYGRWTDGQIGLEITFPKNPIVTTVLWEGLSTKDQTGPILYDSFAGTLPEQVSASDNYYNNYLYLAWQHWGQGMGNPLLPAPLYNEDGSIHFKSNRVRAHHLGIGGNPSHEWNYRILVSFARHWGTYQQPLDKQRKQFSSLYEATYAPQSIEGWSLTVALGLDRGNYLGNSAGGMLTIRKTGIIF